MSKYQLVHELCESRIFRSKQSMDKYSAAQANELLYSILLSTIALALNPKTNAWAKKYSSKSGAFGNFDHFRPTGTDLYVLTYIAQNVNGVITAQGARTLLRLYKELGRGDVDSSYAEQTLLRLERALRTKDARLRNCRRVLTHWSKSSEEDQKQTLTNLTRIVRQHAKLAEVLPYLKTAQSIEPGHFGGKAGAFAVAAAGAAAAGFALGYRYDTGNRWGILRNSAEFDGEKLLTEDRPTQLFTIVQNLNHHPDIEKIIGVNYLVDGVSAFVRATDGNAYELEIRPAPFAKGHDVKRGVTESEEEPKCQSCYDTGWETEKVYDDVVKVPCQYCDAERVAEGCWEWEIMNVITERDDFSVLGNEKAKISRTAKQAAEVFSAADQGAIDNDDPEEARKAVRAMYGVEIVDDFIDVLELPNAENDTDKQQSLFSKDNR